LIEFLEFIELLGLVQMAGRFVLMSHVTCTLTLHKKVCIMIVE